MRHILLLLALLPLIAAAQPASDGYYHDIITAPAYIEDSYSDLTWTIEGQGADYTVNGTCIGDPDIKTQSYKTTSFSISKSKGNYILVESHRAKPHAITFFFTRKFDGTSQPLTFNVYTSQQPFASNFSATGSSTPLVIEDEVTTKTFPLTTDAPYIAIVPGNNFNIKSVDIAWQLTGYERDGLSSNSLGTLCLPYSSSTFSGFTPYSIVGKTEKNGELESIVFQEESSLKAGVPYVFVAHSSTVSVTHNDEPATISASSQNGLFGTYTNYPFDEDNGFADGKYLVVNSRDNCLQVASNKSGVAAYRAFIKIDEVPLLQDAESQGRRLLLTAEGFEVVDGGTTTVTTMTADDGRPTKPLGRAIGADGRCMLNPTCPTIGIVGGRKVLPGRRAR